MKKFNKIKQSDYNRVLITETLPFETPVIFSNDGLYRQVKSAATSSEIVRTIAEHLVLGKTQGKQSKATNPYLYKIRKNASEFRRLALLHPLSQWQLRCLYEKYEHLILHYCSLSPASIRAPRSVAGTFYTKSSWENINQYKTGSLTLADQDKYVKHTPSFFSYSGYDRLYKFFNSRDYLDLEKQFHILKTLDVSKCFDSVYTHSLSWAIKDKEFTKTHVNVTSTFAQEFDQAIRHGNHNETNGIPIGPEASRVFAEIIFQEIDRRTILKLGDLKFGRTYALRRYVDDVFIFASDESIAQRVYDVYSDTLTSFSLHANTAKSTTIRRPFLTVKSRLIFDAGIQTNEFFAKFLDDSESGTLKPKRIASKWKLTKSYVDSIKSLCSSSAAGYDELASFLISAISERVKLLVNGKVKRNDNEAEEAYLAAIEVLLDVIFFLYSVAPSVGASYKLTTTLILLTRFSKKHLPTVSTTVCHHLYSLASRLLSEQCEKNHAEDVDGFVNLEYLNVVLALRELGPNYLLPARVLDDLFVRKRRLSYFTIVSCLFYLRDDEQYRVLRKRILRSASSRLNDLSDILSNSEKTYLLLDLLSCPFVPNKSKAFWINSLYSLLHKTPPSAADLSNFLASAGDSCWQIDWQDVDLLNSLEKKELRQAY